MGKRSDFFDKGSLFCHSWTMVPPIIGNIRMVIENKEVDYYSVDNALLDLPTSNNTVGGKK